MHNVSRTLRGQYSSSGSLRVVVGSLCVAMCVPVFAANGASATAGTPTTQFSGETMRDAYLKTKLGREERRIERICRRDAADGVAGGLGRRPAVEELGGRRLAHCGSRPRSAAIEWSARVR